MKGATPQSAAAASSPLRTETPLWDVPVLRMAYFLEAAHSAVSKKTHMLQVRCANPTGNFAPTQLFELRRCCGRLIFRFRTDPPSVRRCSARLIRQAETLELQPRSRPPSSHTMAFAPKRSTFSRFAACEREPRATSQSAAAASSPYAGEPRVTPQSAAAASSPYILRTDSALRAAPVLRSAYFPIPHRPTFGAPVFRSAYSASRNARASAAFAASIKPYYGLCSKTLDLQPLCGLRKGAEGSPSVCCGDNSP